MGVAHCLHHLPRENMSHLDSQGNSFPSPGFPCFPKYKYLVMYEAGCGMYVHMDAQWLWGTGFYKHINWCLLYEKNFCIELAFCVHKIRLCCSAAAHVNSSYKGKLTQTFQVSHMYHSFCVIFILLLLLFTYPVVSMGSDSLWPHSLQHSRPPCPSPCPGVSLQSAKVKGRFNNKTSSCCWGARWDCHRLDWLTFFLIIGICLIDPNHRFLQIRICLRQKAWQTLFRKCWVERLPGRNFLTPLHLPHHHLLLPSPQFLFLVLYHQQSSFLLSTED